LLSFLRLFDFETLIADILLLSDKCKISKYSIWFWINYIIFLWLHLLFRNNLRRLGVHRFHELLWLIQSATHWIAKIIFIKINFKSWFLTLRLRSKLADHNQQPLFRLVTWFWGKVEREIWIIWWETWRIQIIRGEISKRRQRIS
jgi:hypothetical protein